MALTPQRWTQRLRSASVLPLQDSEGMLDFLPGERLKFITVTIVDNPVPELEKIFRVELFTTDAAGEEFGSEIWMFIPLLDQIFPLLLSDSAHYLQLKAKLTVFAPLFCVCFVCCAPVCFLPIHPPSTLVLRYTLLGFAPDLIRPLCVIH